MIINEIIAILRLIITAVIYRTWRYHHLSPGDITTTTATATTEAAAAAAAVWDNGVGPFTLDLDNLTQLWGVQCTHTTAASCTEFCYCKISTALTGYSAGSVFSDLKESHAENIADHHSQTCCMSLNHNQHLFVCLFGFLHLLFSLFLICLLNLLNKYGDIIILLCLF